MINNIMRINIFLSHCIIFFIIRIILEKIIVNFPIYIINMIFRIIKISDKNLKISEKKIVKS